MKHFTFSHDATEAAKGFACTEGIRFDMIPKALGADPKFWLELVKLNPEYIARVPKKVLEQEEFAENENIDHLRFYKFLPEKYLTVEDYNAFKAMPEKAISVHSSPVQISCDNDFTWYCTNDKDSWIGESKLNHSTLLWLIQEGESPKKINRELWTQGFADYLWESRKAIVGFEGIPDEFIRDNWRKLMRFFREKRYPVFGCGRSIEEAEKLPEYWASFKTSEEMMLALECEELVGRCQNPYGYAESFDFSPSRMERRKAYPQIFSNLWNVVEGVAKDDPEILRRMIVLYGSWFAKFVPKKLFNLEWLNDLEDFELYAESYVDALSTYDFAKTKSEVQQLKAKEKLENEFNELKRVILGYVALNEEELKEFIESLV